MVFFGRAAWGGNYFKGLLDDIAIYNRAISSAEVQQLYSGQSGCNLTVNLSNTDTLSACGNSVTLNAGNAGASYVWNNGSTNQTLSATTSGWYSVTVSQNNCFATDSVYVDLLSVNLGNDTAICAGETYLINPFVKGNPNLKNGLMAAYSFDGNAYDFSGNGNHGKPQGVTPTTDRFGNPNGAYFFRGFGKNDHVFVPNHPSMHIDSVYTMSLWYKEIPGNAMNGVGAYAPTNGTAALFAKEGDGIGTPPGFFADINYNANGGYSLNYLQVDGCCGVRSKFQAQFSHPMQVDSTWKHVVIVNTKDYAETYINGVKVKFASMPSTFLAANRNNLYFGTYGYGKQSPFWYPFYGSMDEVF
ncbi:MAG: LamG-like jellyroll fold domain-containing protein, partial [Bacteroidia bacterium]